jgi:hypothetical protein
MKGEVMRSRPKWTVCYNIVSLESDRWIGHGWEFFDEDAQAISCYERHNKAGNCATKRRYYHPTDYEHLGAAHRFWAERELSEHQSIERAKELLEDLAHRTNER